MDSNQVIKIVLLVVGVVALVYVINLYMKSKKTAVENFEAKANSVSPGETLGKNAVYGEVDGGGELVGNQKPKDCFPKEQLNPSDLLPANADSEWAQSVPSSGKLGDGNFLDAGYHVGVNTVGQSLRNANRQLRSEPSNPRVKVSPWMQTTIDPDSNRKPLEIGGSC
tara:strand:- start:554 stop:1054 length:501 start_codon:yes stop_codon:yes gene_type:complete